VGAPDAVALAELYAQEEGVVSLEAEELDRRIQAWIEHGADEGEEGAAEFGELAVELFAYQYEHNAVYRRFCRARRVDRGGSPGGRRSRRCR